MLGSGKSRGVVNEASNHLANKNLGKAADYMQTKEYQRTRDMNDVIPTHAREVKKETNPGAGLATFNPDAEKMQDRRERQLDDDDDDDELEFLRERRMVAMKHLAQKEQVWRSKQHGQYREIGQDDFFATVVREKGGSDDVAVHFYHKDFERCKILDRHLSDLAQNFLSVKLVKIDVEKSPFLVEKLKVTVLPCIVLFHNDVAVDRIIGFDDLGGDGFSLTELRDRIEAGLRMEIEQ